MEGEERCPGGQEPCSGAGPSLAGRAGGGVERKAAEGPQWARLEPKGNGSSFLDISQKVCRFHFCFNLPVGRLSLVSFWKLTCFFFSLLF